MKFGLCLNSRETRYIFLVLTDVAKVGGLKNASNKHQGFLYFWKQLLMLINNSSILNAGIISKVLLSIEMSVFQKLQTVFDQFSKCLKARQKYSAMGHIFNLFIYLFIFSMFGNVIDHSLSCFILYSFSAKARGQRGNFSVSRSGCYEFNAAHIDIPVYCIPWSSTYYLILNKLGSYLRKVILNVDKSHCRVRGLSKSFWNRGKGVKVTSNRGFCSKENKANKSEYCVFIPKLISFLQIEYIQNYDFNCSVA